MQPLDGRFSSAENFSLQRCNNWLRVRVLRKQSGYDIFEMPIHTYNTSWPDLRSLVDPESQRDLEFPKP